MRVIALVPAYNEEEKIGATVRALLMSGAADEVLVADDHSSDRTAEEAERAGARVIRLAKNYGKGGAAGKALTENPNFDVVLLVDGDVGETAAEAVKLARPVVSGGADMAVAILPTKAGTGGFGLARGLARFLIKARGGITVEAPLSGQRAMTKAAVAASLPFARGYGMETAMTIDVLRDGLRVTEVPADFSHSYTYRDVSGFTHRGRQFLHILKVMFRWPRAKNFKGDKIPTAVGVAIPLAFAAVMVSGLVLMAVVNGSDIIAVLANRTLAANRVVTAWIMVVLVTGAAGFLDDMFGSAQARGFRGHLKALFKGRITTGLIKAASGGLVALAAAWWVRPVFSPTGVIVDALVIALSINVFNLLDLRPGRALKVFFGVMLILGALTFANVFWFTPAVAAVFLTAIAIFPFDLRAKVMLGDSGSNVLGGVAGLGLAVTLPDLPKLIVLAVLIALNVISEKWSFTNIIEKIRPLKWLDELGRPSLRR